jgi:DNA-binding transcriptional regulator YiaG
VTPTEIRAHREGLGLTRGQAGRLFGVPPRTWRRWEIGEKPILKPAALLLRVAFDVPAAFRTLLEIENPNKDHRPL